VTLKNDLSGNLALLLDTHILVWIANGDTRLSKAALDAVMDPDNALFLSAVNAWEYADLEKRGRFAGAGPLEPLLETLEIKTLDLPASVWSAAASLPDIHRDPIDRMMIGHAQMADLTLVTADRKVRKYPVKTFW
jgi:PIN domain nuclease of toxin-antitoxin system